jgi:hypothetical protein
MENQQHLMSSIGPMYVQEQQNIAAQAAQAPVSAPLSPEEAAAAAAASAGISAVA